VIGVDPTVATTSVADWVFDGCADVEEQAAPRSTVEINRCLIHIRSAKASRSSVSIPAS
jgi:hypothetical protein